MSGLAIRVARLLGAFGSFLRSVLCAFPVPTLRVVLRRAVLRPATLGLMASFMIVPHGGYVASPGALRP